MRTSICNTQIQTMSFYSQNVSITSQNVSSFGAWNVFIVSPLTQARVYFLILWTNDHIQMDKKHLVHSQKLHVRTTWLLNSQISIFRSTVSKRIQEACVLLLVSFYTKQNSWAVYGRIYGCLEQVWDQRSCNEGGITIPVFGQIRLGLLSHRCTLSTWPKCSPLVRKFCDYIA